MILLAFITLKFQLIFFFKLRKVAILMNDPGALMADQLFEDLIIKDILPTNLTRLYLLFS